ncbi:MAG: glycosyltransferase family 2 protein [Cyanophyceae cyanobacterium]
MKVSIVIPAHNSAATLEETLSSVRAQTFAEWEAIIVNDGSFDQTETVAQCLADEDSRIQVVRQPQGGVSAARNTGIVRAQHDWLLFLDADDWLAPAHLEG